MKRNKKFFGGSKFVYRIAQKWECAQKEPNGGLDKMKSKLKYRR